MHFIQNITTMSKLMPLVLMYCTFTSCMANQKDTSIIIKGNIKGLPTSKVYLTDAFARKKVFDSAEYKNGEFIFTYKGPIDFEPLPVSIRFYNEEGQQQILIYQNTLLSPSQGNTAFMLERGLTKITGEINSIENNGTNQLKIICGGTENEAFYSSDARFGSLASVDSINRQNLIRSYLKTISKFPASHFLLERISSQKSQYSNDELRLILKAFDSQLKNSKYAKSISDYIENRPKPGLVLHTNYFLNNDKGEKKAIFDTSFKITIFVFWASWCKPCREEIPILKQLYSKYKSQGLQIVSISKDESVENWKKALEQEKMNWPQYLSDKENSKKMDSVFEFRVLPLSIVIDKNGKLLKKIEGHQKDDYLKFDLFIRSFLLK